MALVSQWPVASVAGSSRTTLLRVALLAERFGLAELWPVKPPVPWKDAPGQHFFELVLRVEIVSNAPWHQMVVSRHLFLQRLRVRSATHKVRSQQKREIVVSSSWFRPFETKVKDGVHPRITND